MPPASSAMPHSRPTATCSRELMNYWHVAVATPDSDPATPPTYERNWTIMTPAIVVMMHSTMSIPDFCVSRHFLIGFYPVMTWMISIWNRRCCRCCCIVPPLPSPPRSHPGCDCCSAPSIDFCWAVPAVRRPVCKVAIDGSIPSSPSRRTPSFHSPWPIV
jgi:hypothetical protein